MTGSSGPAFNLFSSAHFIAVATIALTIYLLFKSKRIWGNNEQRARMIERIFAVSLLLLEAFYHIWLINVGRWSFSNSLPLELCSISLLVTIILLWTGNRKFIDFVFFAGIGGAIQALATPVLDLSYPHVRYFHFFYTHGGIILTALYFVWIKGYKPTFIGVVKTILVLNILLPFIFLVNKLTKGNYMFLQEKPQTGSLLDFLGPYPLYILSLEAVAFVMFTLLWLMFRKRT